MRELSDDEIIEVRKATPSNYSRPWGDTLAFARAILAAAQAACPPRDPTQAMIAAAVSATGDAPDDGRIMARVIWRAMHDAWTQDQPAATPSASVGDDAQHGAAQAATDGPAADPIAELCERLTAAARDERLSTGALYAEAADALQRQAREIVAANARCVQFAARWEEQEECALLEKERAERAEVECAVAMEQVREANRLIDKVLPERDALRECVRAMIEWMDHPVPTPDELWVKMKGALDAARAKVKL